MPFPGIDEMFDLERLNGIAEHAILNLAIGHGETIMLSLMFGPGIDLETL